ncbi:MAG: hypothetical protein QQN41_09455 [Nitrosopumilus sp.]
MITTIQLDTKLKQKLDSLKVHHRESYNELISRLVDNSGANFDRESLLATVEVLSDPELIKGISEALIEKGGIFIDDLEKELSV